MGSVQTYLAFTLGTFDGGGMLRITVGKKDEDYTSIQEAINAVPYLTEAEIVVSEGYYSEKLFSDKDNLRLRGIGNVVVSKESGKTVLTASCVHGQPVEFTLRKL